MGRPLLDGNQSHVMLSMFSSTRRVRSLQVFGIFRHSTVVWSVCPTSVTWTGCVVQTVWLPTLSPKSSPISHSSLVACDENAPLLVKYPTQANPFPFQITDRLLFLTTSPMVPSSQFLTHTKPGQFVFSETGSTGRKCKEAVRHAWNIDILSCSIQSPADVQLLAVQKASLPPRCD